MNSIRSFSLLMFAGIVFIGLGHLLILPPFEGFDEAATYSSIRQIAQSGRIPVMRHSFISPEVIDYRAHGPMPYDGMIAHTNKPESYKPDEFISYADFYAGPQRWDKYRQRYRTAAPRVPYTDVTDEYNWEAQHAPLYYLGLAPAMKLTDGLAFVTQFFALRLLSFLLAAAGLLFALRATLKYADTEIARNYIVIGFYLYPFIFPEFFLEFGRLNNDNLCLFILGVGWNFLLPWLRDTGNRKYALATGLCCGLGLFAKMLFVPITAGIVLCVALRAWRRREMRNAAGSLALMLGTALAVGVWWYIYQYVEYESATGALDTINLDKHGGLAANLREHFSLSTFLLGIDIMLTSVSYFTTQSMTYIGAAHRPVLFLMLWIMGCYALELRRQRKAVFIWLPFFLLATLAGGLIWHILISVARSQYFVGGWYMHAAAPGFALMLAYAVRRIAAGRKKRLVFWAFVIYAVPFLAFAFWAQASLFAGCAVRGPESLYKFPNKSYCFDRWDEIAAHLSVTGWPQTAVLCFAAGFLCLMLGLWTMRGLLNSVAAVGHK